MVWDSTEDSIQNAYEFFGWHDVARNTHPRKSTDELVKAFEHKLNDERPENVKPVQWEVGCLATLLVLLGAMYPDFKQVNQEIQKVKNAVKNKPDLAKALATLYKD